MNNVRDLIMGRMPCKNFTQFLHSHSSNILHFHFLFFSSFFFFLLHILVVFSLYDLKKYVGVIFVDAALTLFWSIYVVRLTCKSIHIVTLKCISQYTRHFARLSIKRIVNYPFKLLVWELFIRSILLTLTWRYGQY